jgi:hypothetical protein
VFLWEAVFVAAGGLANGTCPGNGSVCATNLPRQVSATNSDRKGIIERPAIDLERPHAAPAAVSESELPRGQPLRHEI